MTMFAQPSLAQDEGEGDLGPGAAEGPISEDAAAALAETVADDGPPPEPSGPEIAVPSGIAVRWLETRVDAAGPAGLTLRFRFVAPEAGEADYTPETATADLQALCDGWALPRVATTGPQPAQLVLDLADRVVPFGQADDTARQFFEAYAIAGGACQWELF